MIDGLTLVGPRHQVKELRQYEKPLPLAKREVRYLPMPHIIIAPYCTLNMCSSSIAQCRTLHGPSVQTPRPCRPATSHTFTTDHTGTGQLGELSSRLARLTATSPANQKPPRLQDQEANVV